MRILISKFNEPITVYDFTTELNNQLKIKNLTSSDVGIIFEPYNNKSIIDEDVDTSNLNNIILDTDKKVVIVYINIDMSSNITSISFNNSELPIINGNVNILTTAIDDKIAKLEAKCLDLEGRVATLEASIGNKVDLETYTQDKTELNDKLDSIEQSIPNMETTNYPSLTTTSKNIIGAINEIKGV